MIKNIIFDMGNVLAKFDTARFCASRVRSRRDRKIMQREVFASIEWSRLDRGVITHEEAIASIQGRLPEKLWHYADWLVRHWYDHFEPDQTIERFIGALKKKGYRIYLLSNAGFDFYKFKPSLGALRWFDGEIVSADVHLLKPDRQIFDALLNKYALKAEECFFVDDMSLNVEAALNIGFSGMIYRGCVRDLAAGLEKAGVSL
ncbi:HAD family hydrolase [Treponema primitia]|uniref:HAD family hydrolase n=1 Tax=Treponema primitia TaxID=88058 RepID=UPI00059F4E50|nr:HAD family phosphatase [Treponema primitia]